MPTSVDEATAAASPGHGPLVQETQVVGAFGARAGFVGGIVPVARVWLFKLVLGPAMPVSDEGVLCT